MKNKKITANLLLLVIIIAFGAGLITLLPWETAKETNTIGYKSICSFTPVSTVICFLLANTLYRIRKKKTE